MADNELATSTGLVPYSGSEISLPTYDTPQLDVDTGDEIMPGETVGPIKLEDSKLDNRVIVDNRQKMIPPKHWHGSIKKEFNRLPVSVQKAWLSSMRLAEKVADKRVENFVSDLQYKFGSLDKVAEVLAPCLPTLYDLGMTPESYIYGLIEADKECTQRPINYILKIMAANNIDFEDLGAGLTPFVQQAENDSILAPLYDEIDSLKAQINQPVDLYDSQYPSYEEQEDNEIQREAEDIRDYYSQTDSAGNDLYPNAQSIYPEILGYLDAGYNRDESYFKAMEDKRAVIPSNESKKIVVEEDSSPIVYGDERYAKNKEKNMLINLAEQLKQNYM
jgi:hypothetical protein